MDMEELEQWLEGGQETQSFEVKGPMLWSHKSLARDILAMSNVRDGGLIFIGIEDQSFKRIGLSSAELASYKIDEMRDQMTRYADPYVEFSVEFPKDRNGLSYAVIRIAPFKEVPVICRRDSEDTTAGTIYYRTTNRRTESAAVSTANDMREIITIAASRVRSRLEDLGWAVDQNDSWNTRLDEELGGL